MSAIPPEEQARDLAKVLRWRDAYIIAAILCFGWATFQGLIDEVGWAVVWFVFSVAYVALAVRHHRLAEHIAAYPNRPDR